MMAFHDTLWCGSLPRSSEAWTTLHDLGVRTLISVDGAMPDVEAATSHGLRYIHLPMSYGVITTEQQRRLVAAAHDALAQGPVYVHCHHGHHRCAAAAAVMTVGLGHLTPDAAMEQMTICRTSPSYTGLWNTVADMTPLPLTEVEQVSRDFPQAVAPRGMVASMTEAQDALDQFKAQKPADWQPAQAARLAEIFRHLQVDAAIESYPPAFANALDDTWKQADALEQELARANRTPGRATTILERLETSCTACHKAHRR